MTQFPPAHLPLLAALREPASAPILFMVSLSLPAADCAAAAFDGLLYQLRRHGRRPWRAGSEADGCSAAETAVLRLVAALAALQQGATSVESRFLTSALPEWLVRPEGQAELTWHSAALARALATADPHQARPAIHAA